MIVYLFNNYFPDNSGFGRRCEREIMALSTIDEVTVVCRKNENEPEREKYKGNEKVEIFRYSAESKIVHRPANYKSNGFYEIKRNLDLNFAQFKTLFKIFSQKKGKKLQLYAVTSPLTVPLVAMFLAMFFNVERRVVAFHDLEPELAMHMKNLPSSNWLVKVEFFLEKWVTHSYKKIVVTTEGQAEELIQRTGIEKKNVLSIVNSTDISGDKQKNDKDFRKKFNLSSKDFLVMYMSTLSFGYTIDGLLDFLATFQSKKNGLNPVKIVIIGGGEGLEKIQKFIVEHELSNRVYCTGLIEHPETILQEADAGLIPWKQDIMTKTMLPTKLFEYLSLSIPVIAPKFGEFERVLKNKETALLFSSNQGLLDQIELLVNDLRLKEKLGQSGFALYSTTYKPEILNSQFLAFYQEQ